MLGRSVCYPTSGVRTGPGQASVHVHKCGEGPPWPPPWFRPQDPLLICTKTQQRLNCPPCSPRPCGQRVYADSKHSPHHSLSPILQWFPLERKVYTRVPSQTCQAAADVNGPLQNPYSCQTTMLGVFVPLLSSLPATVFFMSLWPGPTHIRPCEPSSNATSSMRTP